MARHERLHGSPMTLGVFALVCLASYRVTRFVTADSVSEPARAALVRRFPPSQVPIIDATGHPVPGSATNRPSWVVAFVYCGWCVSVWVTLACVLVLRLATPYLTSWTIAILAWLSSATVVGFISRLDS